MPDVSGQTDQLFSFLENSGVQLLLITIVALIAFRLVRPLVHRRVVGLIERRAGDGEEGRLTAEESRKRVETVESLISKTLRFLVIVLFVLVVMTIFDLLPVIAGLGLVLAALTVAGQDIIRDYLMGILILTEGPYFEGDWIQVAGVEGTVEEIGIRRTVLRDATGTVHSVSNGEIRTASNLTRVYAMLAVDVSVAFDTDLAKATAIVDQVGREMAEDPEWGPRLLDTPSLLRVGAFTQIGVPLRVSGRVRAADRFAAPGELRRRLLEAFQANKIEIAGVSRVSPSAAIEIPAVPPLPNQPAGPR
jgi:small conductance mechanosensitive channel